MQQATAGCAGAESWAGPENEAKVHLSLSLNAKRRAEDEAILGSGSELPL